MHIKWLQSDETFGIIVAGRKKRGEGETQRSPPNKPDIIIYSAFLSYLFFLSSRSKQELENVLINKFKDGIYIAGKLLL